MAWTTMHFGIGMACAGAAATGLALITRRGWRWIPAVMTLGGVWALVPDMPRTFREDFPSLPLASILGDKSLERWLHAIGDLFFFHHSLDLQPREFALHGLVMILVLYNASIVMLMWRERMALDSPAARAWRAHGDHLPKDSRPSRSRRHTRHRRSRHTPRTSAKGEHHTTDATSSVIGRITPQSPDSADKTSA